MWLSVLQRLTIEFFLDFFYAPIWWYTAGIQRAFLFALGLFKTGNTDLAPMLWVKNLFVPMYGQYDWQGRLMSFFMRFVNIIGRSIALAIWFVVCFSVFLVWILLPFAVFYLFVRSLILL